MTFCCRLTTGFAGGYSPLALSEPIQPRLERWGLLLADVKPASEGLGLLLADVKPTLERWGLLLADVKPPSGGLGGYPLGCEYMQQDNDVIYKLFLKLAPSHKKCAIYLLFLPGYFYSVR